MQEHCLKRPWMIFTVEPFKFWGFLNIGNIQFFKRNLRHCTLGKHQEAWMPEVILAINLKLKRVSSDQSM